MPIAIPLKTMTAADKLQAIEEIWADLAREAGDVPSPVWHGDVLRARERRIADGASRFLDIDDAKAAVREQIK
jgi:hypothetical protein